MSRAGGLACISGAVLGSALLQLAGMLAGWRMPLGDGTQGAAATTVPLPGLMAAVSVFPTSLLEPTAPHRALLEPRPGRAAERQAAAERAAAIRAQLAELSSEAQESQKEAAAAAKALK